MDIYKSTNARSLNTLSFFKFHSFFPVLLKLFKTLKNKMEFPSVDYEQITLQTVPGKDDPGFNKGDLKGGAPYMGVAMPVSYAEEHYELSSRTPSIYWEEVEKQPSRYYLRYHYNGEDYPLFYAPGVGDNKGYWYLKQLPKNTIHIMVNDPSPRMLRFMGYDQDIKGSVPYSTDSFHNFSIFMEVVKGVKPTKGHNLALVQQWNRLRQRSFEVVDTQWVHRNFLRNTAAALADSRQHAAEAAARRRKDIARREEPKGAGKTVFGENPPPGFDTVFAMQQRQPPPPRPPGKGPMNYGKPMANFEDVLKNKGF